MIFSRRFIRIIDICKSAQDFIAVRPGASGLIGNGREPATAIVGEVKASTHVAFNPNQLATGIVSGGLCSLENIGDVDKKTICIESLDRVVFIGELPTIACLLQGGVNTGISLISTAIPSEIDLFPVGSRDFYRIDLGINRDFDVAIIGMRPVVDERVRDMAKTVVIANELDGRNSG